MSVKVGPRGQAAVRRAVSLVGWCNATGESHHSMELTLGADRGVAPFPKRPTTSVEIPRRVTLRLTCTEAGQWLPMLPRRRLLELAIWRIVIRDPVHRGERHSEPGRDGHATRAPL
jgi:hypothetical protein